MYLFGGRLILSFENSKAIARLVFIKSQEPSSSLFALGQYKGLRVRAKTFHVDDTPFQLPSPMLYTAKQ